MGRQVTFTYDPACGRQLIVLQDLLQASNILDGSLASGSCLRGTMDMLARAQTSPHGAPETRCNLDEIEMTDSQREALLKKLSRQMGRGITAFFSCITSGSTWFARLGGCSLAKRLLYPHQIGQRHQWQTSDRASSLDTDTRMWNDKIV